MKVAITGAGGFVGGAIARALVENGADVTEIKHEAIEHFNDFLILNPLQRPDWVIHCAAYGNHFQHHLESETIKANYLHTFELLKICRQCGASFLLMSSTSVRLQHTTLYSATKLGAEALVKCFNDAAGVHGVVARLASVTGPGEQPHRLIPRLIHCAKTGEKMDLVPDPVHDYVDIADVVSAVELLMVKGEAKIYEVGPNDLYSNADVAMMVEQLSGKRLAVNRVESMRPYDSVTWGTKSHELYELGWMPEYTLQESIERMVKEF